MMELLFFISLFFCINKLNLKMVMILNLLFMEMIFFFLNYMDLSNMFEIKKNYGDYGMDKISYFLIFLTIWMISLMILSSFSLNYQNLFLNMMLMMMLSLVGLFFSLDFLSMYMFYEISLIPIIMIIMMWGMNPERLLSMMYMFIYTLFFSLPFLVILLYMFKEFNSINMFYLYYMKGLFNKSFYLFFFMNMIFLVKLPIYMVHLWLPKAHVEAPIFGSMILAGILLKMGGYGLLRIYMHLMNFMNFFLYVMIMIYIGSIIISVICLLQIDLKMLIAYSSVVHMGMMVSSMMSLSVYSIMSSLIMMLGHGLCSSGLFCLLNFNYKRLMSRSMIYNTGMMNYYSKMSMWWFMLCMFNMAAPPSMNLMAEIYLMMGLLKLSLIMLLLMLLLSLFSSIYSIYLFSMTQHGKFNMNNNYYNISIDEYLLIILHSFPLILMFMILWMF